MADFFQLFLDPKFMFCIFHFRWPLRFIPSSSGLGLTWGSGEGYKFQHVLCNVEKCSTDFLSEDHSWYKDLHQ